MAVTFDEKSYKPLQSSQFDASSYKAMDGSTDAPEAQPTTLQGRMASNLRSNVPSWISEPLIGAAKGAASTIGSADDFSRKHLPAFMTNTGMGFGKPEDIDAYKKGTQSSNIGQSVGRGIEQSGEFLVPGAAEEEGAAKLASLIPKAGKYAKPAAQAATSAISTGLVNKAQGGSFGGGMAAGVGGSLLGQGAKALAPKIAETALGITKLDRAFGRKSGQAIIDETTGVTPSAIADSARAKLGELTPELEARADAVSMKPKTQPRGLLQAPQNEIPLNSGVNRGSTKGGLFDAEVNPEETGVPRSGDKFAPISEYPEANPHFLSGSEHPELSGRYAPPSGTLLSREAGAGQRAPVDEFGRVIHPQATQAAPISGFEPNRVASLAEPRGIVSNAIGKSEREGTPTIHGQLQPVNDFLHQHFLTKEQIPENVDPRKLLDMKRGFSKEFLGSWNPETHSEVLDTGRRVYGAMNHEFENAVPGAAELNQRISDLIPVVHRAESTARNAPLAQKIIGRFAAPTGALTAAAIGGTEGYRHGGGLGATVGATGGLVAPLLIATPEGQMIAARTLSNQAGKLIGKGVQGLMMQGNRPDSSSDQ